MVWASNLVSELQCPGFRLRMEVGQTGREGATFNAYFLCARPCASPSFMQFNIY